MIVWLASYPRSGNTFFRALLHRLFGFQTHSLYPKASLAEPERDDARAMLHLTGRPELDREIGELEADTGQHFVKTHDLPGNDNSPAVLIVRDGRDAVVSYAHFVLRSERGVEQAPRELFETTLEEIIVGDHFGGWSKNVEAWINRAGWDSMVRFEELIEDPVNIVVAALRRLGMNNEANGEAPPSFQELQATIPWFFRSGKPGDWSQEMPERLQRLFLERHGDTLLRLGYSERATSRYAVAAKDSGDDAPSPDVRVE